MLKNGPVDLGLLGTELVAGGVPVPFGLIGSQSQKDAPTDVRQVIDNAGNTADLPPAAAPILAAHNPPPPADPVALLNAVKAATTFEELRTATVAALEAHV